MIEIKNIHTGEIICSGRNLRATLRRAIRDGVSLQRADLRGLDLRGLDLRCADLRYSEMGNMSFRDVDFKGANMAGANVSDSNMTQVVVGKFDNPRAYHRRAVLRRIKRFGDVALKNIPKRFRKEWKNLKWTRASKANRPTADLRWANLTGTNLNGVDLRGADIRFARMERSDFSGSDFREVDTTHIIGWVT